MKERLLRLHKARKLIRYGEEFSKKEYKWGIPLNLEPKEDDQLISIGKWKMPTDEKYLILTTRHSGHWVSFYLHKKIMDKIIKSWRRIK